MKTEGLLQVCKGQLLVFLKDFKQNSDTIQFASEEIVVVPLVDVDVKKQVVNCKFKFTSKLVNRPVG